jgi:hypothetical protein
LVHAAGRAWQGARRRPAYTLLSALGCVMILRTAAFIYRYFSSPAWFDFWLWVQDYQRWAEGRFTFHDLIKPHYDDAHRIATTRVLLLLDSILFDMNGWLPVIASFLLLLTIGWIVSRLATRDGAPVLLPPLMWMALACSTCQLDNLIYPFQVQFPITCALACGCAWLLTNAAGAAPRRSAALGVAAGVLAIMADFSMGSGILLAVPMLLLLALRRARWQAWAAFAPLCVLGVVLDQLHRRPMLRMPLLGWQINGNRARYIGNFLASDLNGFSEPWTWIVGLTLLAAFLALGVLLLRRNTRHRAAVPSGDAALLALGAWLAACGPAGSMTMRLAFGPGAALVARYATMSLLFASVLLALAIRAAALSAINPIARVVLPLAAVAALGLFNLPRYGDIAGAFQRVIASDAELLVNNIAVQGPSPLIFGGGIEDIRSAALFLHARQLNMFAPENGPPPALLAAAQTAVPATLPVCRGWLDYAYALDSTGFLLRGWAADPAGKHAAGWIAALDESGRLAGMARPLGYVVLAAAATMKAEPREFESGFRFQGGGTDADTGRLAQVVALFPGKTTSLCRLPVAGQIGPLHIVPITALQRTTAIAQAGAPNLHGFTSSGRGTWQYDGPANGALQFSFAPGTGVGRDLAVPFATTEDGPGRRMVIHLADGMQASIALPQLWQRPDWRAVVIPASLIARHGGVMEVDVAGAGALTVGAPMGCDVDPNWARLF